MVVNYYLTAKRNFHLFRIIAKQNVEALATGESFPDGEIACFGDGSVDCPFTYLKVEVVYREE
jgi:hypothetical protein